MIADASEVLPMASESQRHCCHRDSMPTIEASPPQRFEDLPDEAQRRVLSAIMEMREYCSFDRMKDLLAQL
ncbi:hypothetical protein FJZ27_00260 [Candidatus Peribacteria bacterium]|nr:hypothetical protein [Candidatus Peribacteria bacterium]